MKFYLVNAFSINMLARGGQSLAFIPISVQGVKNILKNEHWTSAVGHQDTANILENLLNVPVDFNRESITLNNNVSLIVAQYTGPRLVEGTTVLPKNSTLNFWQVYKEN